MEKLWNDRSQPVKYFIQGGAGLALGFALSRLFRLPLRQQIISGAIGSVALLLLPKMFKGKPLLPLGECADLSSINAFAERVYEAQEEGKNVIFSPISLWLLLHQVKAGASEEISDKLKEIIGKSPNSEQVSDLIKQLQGESMKIAHLCLVKKESTLNPTFKSLLDAYRPKYDTLKNAKQVNDWVKKNTAGMIPEILKPDEVNNDTVTVLANALAFIGKWAIEFGPKKTEDEQFAGAGTVKMMKTEKKFHYWENEKYKFLKTFYSGNTFSRIFMLPKKKEGSLKDAMSQKFPSSEGKFPSKVSFWLPKVECEQTIDVKSLLNVLSGSDKLGDSLGNLGSLSEMLEGQKDIALDVCRHKAKIEDDEKGTKAAAVTVATVMKGMSPPRIREFHCNRPYASVILHEETQMPIFVSRISSPKPLGNP